VAMEDNVKPLATAPDLFLRRLSAAEWTLTLSLAAALAVTVWQCARAISIPYQIDYGEGLLLEGAIRLTRNLPLYSDPRHFPVSIHVYGPVAYGLVAAATNANGVGFVAPRILVFVCALAIAGMTTLMLWRWTGSWWIAWVFGFVFLTLPAMRVWLYLARADLLGLTFVVLGLTAYVLRPSWFYLSAALFLAALFTKYTLVAAPASVLLHMLLTRAYQRLLGMVALLAGGAGTVAFVLQRSSHGWFLFHMARTHADPYSFYQWAGLWLVVAVSAPVIAALAVAHLWSELRRVTIGLAATYFLAACLTGASAGKLGSTTNHFVEWMLGSCICAALAYERLKRSRPAIARVAAVCLGASVLVGTVYQARPEFQPFSDMAECQSAYEYVARSPARAMLAQSLGPVLLAGKPVLLSDPFVYTQLVRTGLWSDQPLLTQIKDKQFGLIITDADVQQMKAQGTNDWTPGLLTALAQNYRTVRRFNCGSAPTMLEPTPTEPARSGARSPAMRGPTNE